VTRWVRTAVVLVLTALVAGSTGCAKKQVTRLDTESTVDLSGEWNDSDSRMVSGTMISSAVGGAWLTNFLRAEGENPVVIAGSIKNRTSEHISTRVFLKDIQRAFINSGQVDVVADRTERDEVRDERLV